MNCSIIKQIPTVTYASSGKVKQRGVEKRRAERKREERAG